MSIIIPRYAPGIAARAYAMGIRRVSAGGGGGGGSPPAFPTGLASLDRRVSPGSTGVVSHPYSSSLTTTPVATTTPGRYPITLALFTPCTVLNTITSGGGIGFGIHGETARNYAQSVSFSDFGDGSTTNLVGQSRVALGQCNPAADAALLYDTDYSGVGTVAARDYNWSSVSAGAIKWELALDPLFHDTLANRVCDYIQPVRFVGNTDVFDNPVGHRAFFAWGNSNTNTALALSNLAFGPSFGMACLPFNGGGIQQFSICLGQWSPNGRHSLRAYDTMVWQHPGSTTVPYGIEATTWPTDGSDLTCTVVGGTIASNQYNYFGRFLSPKQHLEVLSAPTVPGPQVVTGVGFRPNMFTAIGGRATLNTGHYYTAAAGDINCMIGVQLGPDTACAAMFVEESTGGSSSPGLVAKSYATEDQLVTFIDDAGVIAAAEITEVTDDGFTLNWTQVTGGDFQVGILATGLE